MEGIVITADLVQSTQWTAAHHEIVNAFLQQVFEYWNDSSACVVPFEKYRGDSFQGALQGTSMALVLPLKIRVGLKALDIEEDYNELDARISIGVGGLGEAKQTIRTADGAAFRLSGRRLDQFRTEERIAITTAHKASNADFDVMLQLLETIISRWSTQQAQVVDGKLEQKSQQQIASELNISQSAVHQRLKTANWHVVQHALSWAEEKLKNKE